jgi:hypothetical protein
MPTLEENLAEGLSIQMGNGGRWTARRTWHAKDLTGATPFEAFASALALAGAPQKNDTVTVQGRVLYCDAIDLDPWPPADAIVRATYNERPDGSGTVGSSSLISGGAVLQEVESDFSYAELQKPFAERQPITVEYDPDSTGAPGAGALEPQSARVPMLAAKQSISFTRVEDGDPTDTAKQCAGRTNSATWKGLAAGTALMVEIRFESRDNGATWTVSYTIAYDEAGWTQVARYRLENGTLPELVPSQLAAENGAKEIVVQGEADFNLLAL